MSFRNELSTETWIIGSGAECDLVVPQAMVSGQHCRLTRQGNEYWIEDLRSTNGTYVTGQRLGAGVQTPLQQGARVTLGMDVAMPWPRGTVKDRTQTITIGRSPNSDVQIDLPIVSWDHARVVLEGKEYILEDLDSRNGTYLDSVDNRVTRAVLRPESSVYLGSYKIAASRLISGRKVEIGDSAYNKVMFRGDAMVIGRDPSTDVVLDYPMVSWRHARLTRVPEGILVEDLNSRNGTFVRGTRVNGKVLAKAGEEIGLGSFRFQILESGELAQREYSGNVTIEAENVVVNTREGKRLIEPVSLTVFPSELVAVMGGAGAGKTTLLKALNGYTPPAEGRVLFNGASLYQYYDRFRQQMGYVPQDDIVHPQLTVGEALYYSARLRTDLTDSEIRTRVKKVLTELRIEDKIDTQIGSAERKTLSGGQRKRVNIGLELINDTPVLFLDEPTSGLSSYDAESLIDLLKQLSREGKTIITTIHQPSLKIYKQFDDLIMVNRDQGGKTGSMVYFGPAYPNSIQFFAPPAAGGAGAAPAALSGNELSPDVLLSSLPNRSSAEWRELYKKSRYHRDFVDGRSGKQPSTPKVEETPRARHHFDFRQWFALIKRNTIVKTRDKAQSAILLLQAPLFAVLIFLVYQPLSAKNGFAELTPKLAGVHFLIVVAAIWFGCNNAARDIVGEWTVYRRERMVTLKLSSYVFSKVAVLFVLCVVQCLSLLVIVYFALGLKGDFGRDLLVLVVSSLIGSGLGLCISAFSQTTESAIALLPVVLLPIIALGGGMRPIYQIDQRFRWVTTVVPSRWAFEANLLQETGCDKWTKREGEAAIDFLPDPADPVQKPAGMVAPPAPATPGRGKAGPVPAVQEKGPVPCPVPSATRNEAELNGDVAELSVPHYLVKWKKDGEEKTTRAFATETSQDNTKAVNFRDSFQYTLTVLLAMMVALVIGVLAILKKRDSDVQ